MTAFMQRIINDYQLTSNRIGYLQGTVVAFGLGLLLNQYTGISWLQTAAGLLLYTVLPGYYVAQIIALPTQYWRWYGRFGFYTLLALATVAICQLLTKSYLPLTAPSQITLILLINAGLYTLTKLLKRESGDVVSFWRNLVFTIKESSRAEHLVLFAPIALFLIMLAIDPLINDSDNYLTILETAISNQGASLYVHRAFFIPYYAAYHYITELPTLIIYKVALSALFYSSLLYVFDVIRHHIKHTHLSYLAYISIMAAPVILIEASIVRPQIIVMAYTLPILFLLLEAVRRFSWQSLFLALWFSIVAFGFHELGSIFLLTAAAIAITMGYQAVYIKKTVVLTAQKLALAVLIVLPYLLLFKPLRYLEPFIRMFRSIANASHVTGWDWWFIDSYKTIDGFNLGWPGIQALYYYLYNGLLFLFVFIGLSLWTLFANRQTVAERRKTWYFAIPFLYVFFYFVTAEVLPRLGIAFLPNRAWPHLMLGLIALLILYLEQQQSFFSQRIKQLAAALAIPIVAGIGGLLYITNNNVSTVYKDELAAARFIREKTDPKALIVSTQATRDLVYHYAKRPYYRLSLDYTTPQFTSNQAFNALVMQDVDQYIAKRNQIQYFPEESEIVTRYSGDLMISTTRNILQAARTVPPTDPLDKSKGVYFLYSLARFNSINGSRPYNQPLLDALDKPYFTDLNRDDVVYDDGKVIIIELYN
jgi:hypothetical protein